jgi:hypothetical protein
MNMAASKDVDENQAPPYLLKILDTWLSDKPLDFQGMYVPTEVQNILIKRFAARDKAQRDFQIPQTGGLQNAFNGDVLPGDIQPCRFCNALLVQGRASEDHNRWHDTLARRSNILSDRIAAMTKDSRETEDVACTTCGTSVHPALKRGHLDWHHKMESAPFHFRKCTVCMAQVLPQDAEKHQKWHGREDQDSLHQLFRKCVICFAQVLHEDVVDHDNWHNQINAKTEVKQVAGNSLYWACSICSAVTFPEHKAGHEAWHEKHPDPGVKNV